jgi:hypothetical protein
MWENVLIIVIVGVCAIFILRRFQRQLKGKSGCGCSCSGCSGPDTEKSSCCDTENK